MTTRFPRRVFGTGSEPDPRFSLANERTYLAWVRTSLALVLAGVALEALDAPMQRELRFAAALLFVLLGLISIAHGWLSWAANEKSLRLETPLQGFAVSALVSAGIAVAIVLVFLGSVLAL